MQRRTSNNQERHTIRTLDNLKLYDELMPAIVEAIKAGGGSDQILKKSEAMAALKLIQSLDSDKADVSLKAAIEVLNRVSGKPVERTLNIYGDLSKMNERDIDNQILRAIQKSGAHQLIDAVVQERPLLKGKIKQSRKPRKSDPLGTIPTEIKEQP